jgi:transcriptional regulator with XRE-family HTH domain
MNPIPASPDHSVGMTAVDLTGTVGSSGTASMLDSLADIGTHLRAARVARGLSLREMARRIEVSPSFVSQVELGKAKPSLGTLYGFLSELDLSLDELMPGTEVSTPPAAPAVTSTTPGTPLESPDRFGLWLLDSTVQPWAAHPLVQMKGVTWRRLTADDPQVDFLHVTYEPGSESCPPDHLMRHQGHEYGHVTSGRLRVQVAFETFDLGPGDAINFSSATPHRLSNEGAEACTSIWVVVGRRSTSSAPSQDANSPLSQVI